MKGGERVRIADRMGEIIYTPGHSSDSICIYIEEEGILFAGDTPLIINSEGSKYEPGFVQALEYICQKDIRTIYFGHGTPLNRDCNKTLRRSLQYVEFGIGQ